MVHIDNGDFLLVTLWSSGIGCGGIGAHKNKQRSYHYVPCFQCLQEQLPRHLLYHDGYALISHFIVLSHLGIQYFVLDFAGVLSFGVFVDLGRSTFMGFVLFFLYCVCVYMDLV